MSENLRTGAAAASRPRDEDVRAGRSQISDQLAGGLGHPSFAEIDWAKEQDPNLASLVPYPVTNWAGVDVAESSRSDSGLSSVYRPQSAEQSIYSVFFRWPDNGGASNLLGMFIRYRVKGTTAWQTDYRQFTATIDSYGPSNQNLRDLYAEQIYPLATNEYQIITKYIWTPDPNYEYKTQIFDGASFQKVQRIQVAESVRGASSASFREVRQAQFSLGIVFKDIDERETVKPASAKQLSSVEKFSASFADTVSEDKPETTAGSHASIIKHTAHSFFTYADEVDETIGIGG